MSTTTRVVSALLLGLTIFIVTSAVHAQAAGTVTGRIVDGERDYALDSVRVRLEDTRFSTRTDTEGRFRLDRVPPGEYAVVVDYIGYERERRTIEVAGGRNPELNFRLQPATTGSIDTIEVRAAREGSSRALNRQRLADNLKRVVAADFVGQFPDKNIAEATQRLPGIGIQRDQGEGRFVNIRGTPVEFANVSVDGTTVPSPNAGTRAVDLDSIPSDIISLLEVSKTLTPDMDAEAIAGNINIVTQGAFDADRRFLRASAAGGQNRQGSGDRFEGSFTYGDVFGPDDRIGLVIGANFSRTDRATDNIEHDWSRQNPGGLLDDDILLLDETELKDYELVRRDRRGINARLDFKLREDDRAFVAYKSSRFRDSEIRQETAIDWDGNHRPGATRESGVADGVRVTKELRDRTVVNEIDIFSLGSTHYIGEGRLQLRGSYSESQQFHPIRTQLAYRTGANNTIAYDFTDTDFPVFTLLDESGNAVPGNLRALEDDLQFRQWRPRPIQGAEEEEISLQADYQFPISGFGDASELQFGVKARLREKVNEEFRTQNRDGSTAPSFGELAGATDSNNFGLYNTGRRFRADAIRDLARAGTFDNDSLVIRLEQSVAADYDTEENIYAAYGMLTSDFGPTSIVAGVRVEHTDAEGTANLLDDDTDEVSPITESNSYTKVFPSINLRREIGEDIILRAAYSTGLSRPNFEFLAPFAIVSEEDDEVERGNPALDPTFSHNFDLIGEYYLRPSGLLSVGLFYKRLQDTIFVAESIVEDGPFAGFLQERPENGGSGEVYGVELSWSQTFDFLPEPFAGLGVNTNYTYTESDADKPFGLGSSNLPGTSKHTVNASLFYALEEFSVRLAYNYRSKYLNSFNVGDPELDNFWDARGVLDLTASYQVSEQVRLFGEFSNITNTRQRRFDGVRSRVNELEEFGQSWLVGMRYAF